MKLSQVIDLSNILVKIVSKDMPFSLSYKFNKLITLIDTNEQFYNSKVRELLEQYGEHDENGRLKQSEAGIQLKPETQPEFYEKFEALREVEVDEKLPTFTVSELECLSISPQDLYPLMPLIVE